MLLGGMPGSSMGSMHGTQHGWAQVRIRSFGAARHNYRPHHPSGRCSPAAHRRLPSAAVKPWWGAGAGSGPVSSDVIEEHRQGMSFLYF